MSYLTFNQIYDVTDSTLGRGERGDFNCAPDHIVFKGPAGEKAKVMKDQIKTVEWYSVRKQVYQVTVFFTDKKKTPLKFQGFSQNHKEQLERYVTGDLGKLFNSRNKCLDGANFGKFRLKSGELQYRSTNDDLVASLGYNSLQDAVLQGKNEIGLLFKPTQIRDEEMVSEMRIVVPDIVEDNEDDDLKQDVGEAAQEFLRLLKNKAKLNVDEGDVFAEFGSISFRAPRGKFQVKFFPKGRHMNLFNKSSTNIKYDAISKLFLFQQPNGNYALVLALNLPFRQGVTEYRYLIMDFKEGETCELNLEGHELSDYKVNGKQLLQEDMKGNTHSIVSKLLLALAQVKIYTSRSFKSSQDLSCVRCSIKGFEGLLYPLERSFFFIHKPTHYIKHNAIKSVAFKYDDQQSTSRGFDFIIKLRDGNNFVFNGIHKKEIGPIFRMVEKKLRVERLEKVKGWVAQLEEKTTVNRPRRTAYVPGQMAGMDGGGSDAEDEPEPEGSSPDEDYNEGFDKKLLDEDDENSDEWTSGNEKIEGFSDEGQGGGGDDADNAMDED